MNNTLSVRFARVYNFTAAHRLHSVHLSDEVNRTLYGKCNNPAGHGHNYRVTVVVEGTPDPVSGMIINMTDLDGIADKVLRKFSYHHLDLEVADFVDRPSTAENIVTTLKQKFMQEMVRLPDVSLARLELSETRNNSCTLIVRKDKTHEQRN